MKFASQFFKAGKKPFFRSVIEEHIKILKKFVKKKKSKDSAPFKELSLAKNIRNLFK